MKIDLRGLPEGELISIIEQEDPDSLELNTSGIKIVSPLEIKADIRRIQDVIDIKLNLKSQAAIQCSRCLEEISFAVERSFRLDYSISGKEKILDISDDIRQEIILGYPLKPLCKASCRGLCPRCGKNLNDGDCGHEPQSSCFGHLRFRI